MKIPFTNIEIGRITNVDKSQPQSSRITSRIIARQLYRQKQEIGDLRRAIQYAESETLPDRAELIRIYKDVLLDAHLSGIWETLRQRVQEYQFILVDDEGETDAEATKKLESLWFSEVVGHIIDSKLYGHSLIQLGAIKNDEFTSVELVRREYVTPELTIVKRELHAAGTGTNYTAAPYRNWLIEAGDRRDLGLLSKAAFWAIWKKGVVGNWSEFAEIFGMPTRIGRTDINDPANLQNMDRALKEAGSAAYALLDKDDEIEFIETSRGDAFNVYNELIERANSEMSKLVVGQTMTSDDGSSLSQSQTHKDVFELRAWALGGFVCDIVNTKLLPLMRFHGIPVDGLKCKIKEGEKVTQVEKQNFVVQLLQHYEIDPAWINAEFNIPVDARELAPMVEPGPQNLEEIDNKISTVMNDVNRLYQQAYEHANKHKH